MIGILTLHYGYNEGAILQAYALARIVSRIAGETAEIIDHRYPAKVAIYNKDFDGRKAKLAKAIDNWLPLSPWRIISDDDRDTWERVTSRYRCVIVGSDQVWRLRYRRRLFGLRVDQPDGFVGRFPNVYWPPEHLPIARFAYAASIGDLDPGPIPVTHRRMMGDRLSKFLVIGVRDLRTANFVKSLAPNLGDKIMLCPDPTFLIDWDTSEAGQSLNDTLASFGIRESDRLCLMALDSSPFAKDLSSSLASSGYITVGYASWDDFSQVRIASQGITPLEWVALFQRASICVTDRMHAFIFSMLFHCPCIVIDRFAGEFTRIADLAQSLEYPYIFKGFSNVSSIIDAIKQFAVSWSDIDERVELLRRLGTTVLYRIASYMSSDSTEIRTP